VAKTVLLEDERGYVMAIIPASCRLQLLEIDRTLGRHLELATEEELGQVFEGCEVGAVPPVGAAYYIPTAIDDSLLRLPDVYFEAGDHEDLVTVSREGFWELLAGSPHGRFSRPS
jgi:Ala-tRNA(Pro) deacylase